MKVSVSSEQNGWEHKEMKMTAGSGAIKFELIWRCERRSQWNGQGWRYKREEITDGAKAPKGLGDGLTVEGSQNSSYFKNKSESHSVVSDSLQPCGPYNPWNSPGQNTGVGSLSLLQGIFPILGLNPGLPHCRQILYQLRHQGSPRTLEWVAYPFSSGSSPPRNGTGISCIAGRFFTNWAISW